MLQFAEITAVCGSKLSRLELTIRYVTVSLERQLSTNVTASLAAVVLFKHCRFLLSYFFRIAYRLLLGTIDIIETGQ